MGAMIHTPIQSSLLASAGYDPATQTMEIRFARGGLYSYTDVSPEQFAAFQAAESKGKHFLGQIKGNHEFRKIEEVPDEAQ